jgi:hypothetical protein
MTIEQFGEIEVGDKVQAEDWMDRQYEGIIVDKYSRSALVKGEGRMGPIHYSDMELLEPKVVDLIEELVEKFVADLKELIDGQ